MNIYHISKNLPVSCCYIALAAALLTMTGRVCSASQWTVMDSSTDRHLYGIWGSNSSDIFAVGQYGTIIHYDGSAWSLMDGKTADTLYDVWGAGGDDVFAAGRDGTILHYDGSGWSSMNSHTSRLLHCIWGYSSKHVYAVGDVGDNTTIVHYDGAGWSAVNTTTLRPRSLFAVWGTGPDNIFTAGWEGTLAHYDGALWNNLSRPTEAHIYGLDGTGADSLYAVGEDGVILTYAGGQWSQENFIAAGTLNAIHAASWARIYAVGDTATAVRYDGFSWSAIACDARSDLEDVWVSSDGVVFAVGPAGTILRYTDGASETTTTAAAASSSTTTSLPVTKTTTTTASAGALIDFTATPTAGYLPLTVSFVSLSETDISSLLWDFGDSSPESAAQNPVHTYTRAGTYSVTLTAFLPDGATCAAVKEKYIFVAKRSGCIFSTSVKNRGIVQQLRSIRNSLPDTGPWPTVIAMYYRNAPELYRLFSDHPHFRERLSRLLSENREIVRCTAERKITSISQKQTSDIIAFINELSLYARPGLKSALHRLASYITRGDLFILLGIISDR